MVISKNKEVFKMSTKKFNFKQNPENSSVIQALLDISQANPYLKKDIDAMICLMRADSASIKRADEIFRSHLYPDNSLTFCKLECGIEFTRFLPVNAVAILTAMCQNMRHGNLIQLSHRDILTISALKSLRSVKPALEKLIELGCIAEKIPGTTRRATVYMVNPSIATVGTKEISLQRKFWKLTGTQYVGKKIIYSETHKVWNKLTAKRTYSRGYSSLEIEGSEKPIYFSRINEPKIKKAKSDSSKQKTETERNKEQNDTFEPNAEAENEGYNEQIDSLEEEEEIEGIDQKIPF